MKRIIYILILFLFFSNCSDSCDINTDIPFLEKYEGTVWLKSNPEQVLYIRFINSSDTPLEYWIRNLDCFNYRLEKLYGDNCLTINLEDTLEFRYCRNIDATDYINIIKIEISDIVLSLKNEHYEDELLVSTEYLNYDKSKEDVDKLPLCD
ncbi:MAG: hypothetical protein HKO92_11675 [Flavobacteriaceae bacterium]|nr:hypothetical protein [Flavobacteriaceae bacterium]